MPHSPLETPHSTTCPQLDWGFESLPGLVDLQLNGYAGFDFNGPAAAWTPEAMHQVRNSLRSRGVVQALPTVITDDAGRMLERARAYAACIKGDEELAAAFPGLHIEGPFISSEAGPRGAHPEKYCRTPALMPDLLQRLQDASEGRVLLFTLAPELEGALGFIDEWAGKTCIALGHTAADSEILQAAVDAGARMATHLGNGSHQALPRHDNYIQHQLADDRLFASFIADGHHLPFPVLKNFLRAKTFEKSILVTDAISAAGVGPGRYPLGGEEVTVSDTLRCQIPGQPNLAGSALTLDRAVLNVSRYCGVSFGDAWAMASTRPAELVGLPYPEAVALEIHEDGFRRI